MSFFAQTFVDDEAKNLSGRNSILSQSGETPVERRPTPALFRVHNRTRGTLLAARASLAQGFHDRSVGLLGHKHLAIDEGMLFESPKLFPVMWMHTFLMAFPIDIVFLDRRNVVLRINTSLKPGRFSSMVVGARKALELAAGTALRTQTAIGDSLSLEALLEDRSEANQQARVLR
jgi:uncharacterized membrane protein (UPF0127 family)